MRRPRVLLIQVRSHPAAKAQEQLCFLERCGLTADRLDAANVVEDPEIPWERVARADAVFMGGAGAHSVTHEYPFTAPLRDLVLRIVDEGPPFFGSCWGHHFLAQVLGGKVVTDLERGEVGTFDVELTSRGREDPLFGGLPPRFPAQLGHHDRVAALPAGVEELALSDRCPFQALRVTGKPVYGTQFHSEMNAEQMRDRMLMYQRAYLDDGMTVEEFDRLVAPTPETESLLRRFLELYA